jgi:hypothetical protein
MTDVAFVCVHENLPTAEALADLFERGGFSVGDDAVEDATVIVALLSVPAMRSRAFLTAAERAQRAGKLILASVDGDAPERIGAAAVLDISAWNGEPDSEAVDALFFAVDRMVTVARLAARNGRTEPDAIVIEPAFTPPLVEARAPWRKSAASSPMMRAVALTALLGGGALLAGLTAGHAMRTATARQVTATAHESAVDADSVRFAVVANDAMGGAFVDAAPSQEAQGWRGLEPPSTESLNGARQR